MRRRARVDANQPATVELLRRSGWKVWITSMLGKGFPDLMVSRKGFAAVVELKDGDKPPSAQKLTPQEQDFRDSWEGPYVLANSPEDAARQLAELAGTKACNGGCSGCAR